MTIAFPTEETNASTAPSTAPNRIAQISNSEISNPSPRKLPLSEKRLAANRANAQKSTGPRTPEGKSTVSQNATTHGLTSATPLLADGAYSLRLYELKKEHRPTTPSQHYLIEQLAHIGWKLEQIPAIEAHLLAQLKIQTQSDSSPSFASLFAADLLSEKPTPLTRLWDLHRRLLSQFQSILRQIPRLKKQAQDQDEEQAKFEKDRERGQRLDRFLADLPAHNARCDAAHAAQYNLPPDHPAIRPIAYGAPAQIKPTTESEISNPQTPNPEISDREISNSEISNSEISNPPAQIKPTAPSQPSSLDIDSSFEFRHSNLPKVTPPRASASNPASTTQTGDNL